MFKKNYIYLSSEACHSCYLKLSDRAKKEQISLSCIPNLSGSEISRDKRLVSRWKKFCKDDN